MNYLDYFEGWEIIESAKGFTVKIGAHTSEHRNRKTAIKNALKCAKADLVLKMGYTLSASSNTLVLDDGDTTISTVGGTFATRLKKALAQVIK